MSPKQFALLLENSVGWTCRKLISVEDVQRASRGTGWDLTNLTYANEFFKRFNMYLISYDGDTFGLAKSSKVNPSEFSITDVHGNAVRDQEIIEWAQWEVSYNAEH